MHGKRSGIMSKPVIHLLGDAILDNYHQLSSPDRDLRKELTDLGFRVNNCAVDDVKVADIINGIVPRALYTKSRSYPYPLEKDGKMYPLNSVLSTIGVNKSFAPVYSGISAPSVQKAPSKDNMVVISMGGNDIHAHVGKIIFGANVFLNSVLTPEFARDFSKVIETVRSSCDKIVLVSIYLPYLGVASSYGVYTPFAKPIMAKWNKFIYENAKKYNIPVLDLNRTLNVGNRSHYGKDDTRVSNISNKCIAKCLAHIYANYDGFHVYYSPNCDYSNITVE